MDILRRISVYPAKSRLLKNTALGKFCKKTFAALKYSPAVPFARWIFLALSAAAVAFGYGALFGFVEPYSLYGKIMGGIVHPAASVAVDESGRLLANFGVYSSCRGRSDCSPRIFCGGNYNSRSDLGGKRIVGQNLLQHNLPGGGASRAIFKSGRF